VWFLHILKAQAKCDFFITNLLLLLRLQACSGNERVTADVNSWITLDFDVLQEEWLCEKQAELQQLKEAYERTVNCVGEGHRQAVGEEIVSWLCEEYIQ